MEHHQETDRPLRDLCALAGGNSEAAYEQVAQGEGDPVSSISPTGVDYAGLIRRHLCVLVNQGCPLGGCLELHRGGLSGDIPARVCAALSTVTAGPIS